MGNMSNNIMNTFMNQNPMLKAFSQLMHGKLPIDQMLQQNPNLQPYWQQAQTMAQGKNNAELQQMVNQLCKQNGVDFNQIKSML
jgi:hypothetical protein